MKHPPNAKSTAHLYSLIAASIATTGPTAGASTANPVPLAA